MYHLLIRKGLLNMKTVLIVGANGRVSIEATKIFLENSRFNVDLFLRNAHRIPDYASNRIKVYEGDAKNIEDFYLSFNYKNKIEFIYYTSNIFDESHNNHLATDTFHLNLIYLSNNFEF